MLLEYKQRCVCGGEYITPILDPKQSVVIMPALPDHDIAGTVTVLVLGPDVVDFEWNNGESYAFAVWAHGYLRGFTFLLRINDEDCKVDLACNLRQGMDVYEFHITESHGTHSGLTSSDDRMIDSHMLLHDDRLRLRMQTEKWAGEKTFTHFECIRVVSKMLKAMSPGWSVIFDETPAGADSCPLLSSVLESHITLLQVGVTHATPGVRRMVYM